MFYLEVLKLFCILLNFCIIFTLSQCINKGNKFLKSEGQNNNVWIQKTSRSLAQARSQMGGNLHCHCFNLHREQLWKEASLMETSALGQISFFPFSSYEKGLHITSKDME